MRMTAWMNLADVILNKSRHTQGIHSKIPAIWCKNRQINWHWKVRRVSLGGRTDWQQIQEKLLGWCKFSRCSFLWQLHSSSLVTKSCPALLQPHRLWPTRLLYPWDFPGKNTRVDCHFHLQGILLTQGSNLHLLHCRWILYHWAIREAARSLDISPNSTDYVSYIGPPLFLTD